MNYKKILKNRNTRRKLLELFRFVPDERMLKFQYYIKMGRRLELKNPQRYSEKLQWYKLHDKNPEMIRCVDKYEVRSYVAEKGLAHILNTCIGVYDRVEDIDFDSLPRQFAAKDTLGGGGNDVAIIKDKASADLAALRSRMKDWTDKPAHIAGGGREWPYYSGKEHRIIIENYLEEPNGDLRDYKFLCFGGKVAYIVYDCDRFTDHKRNIYDKDWRYIKVDTDHECFEDSIPKPENLEEMKQIAETLSAGFPHVRVDLYNVNGKIYFGELTFFPWSGYVQFSPDTFDFDVGSRFALEGY